MTAPFPATDACELPYKFMALTFTKMLLPQSKLNGTARRTLTGMIHIVDVD